MAKKKYKLSNYLNDLEILYKHDKISKTQYLKKLRSLKRQIEKIHPEYKRSRKH